MKPQVFLLIAAVVLAGCIGQPTGGVGGGTAGVIITSFSPEVPEVDSNSEVIFFTNVKNVGDFDVSDVVINLFSLDDWTGSKTSPSFALKAADPVRGLEGEESLQEFKLTSPTKSVSVTYTPTARVTYAYRTKSTIQFSFATREQIRGVQAESTAKVTTTGSPFLITVRGKLPVITSTAAKATVQLEIQNVGGGRASDGTDIDNIQIGVTPSGASVSCTPTGKVRLIGGKSRLITCTLSSFTNVPAAGFATSILDVTLDYRYFVETSASVTVLKPIT